MDFRKLIDLCQKIVEDYRMAPRDTLSAGQDNDYAIRTQHLRRIEELDKLLKTN